MSPASIGPHAGTVIPDLFEPGPSNLERREPEAGGEGSEPEPTEQRELTELEIRLCARRAAETLARWLPAEVATAVANNACCVLIGERRPLDVDLRAPLAGSIAHASQTPDHERRTAARRATHELRRLIAVVLDEPLAGRSELDPYGDEVRAPPRP